MTLDNNGYIYLIQEREFYNKNEPVYKIGRIEQLDNKRIKNYPSGSKLFIQLICNDCHKNEKTLIETFKEKFLQRKDIGREYFEGDVSSMIDTIFFIVRNIDDVIEFDKKMENEYKTMKQQQKEEKYNSKKKETQIKEEHKLLKTFKQFEDTFIKKINNERDIKDLYKYFMRTIEEDPKGKLNINQLYTRFTLFFNECVLARSCPPPVIDEFKKIMENTYGVSTDNDIYGYSFYEEFYYDFMEEYIIENPTGKLNLKNAYNIFKKYFHECGTNAKVLSNEEFKKFMEKNMVNVQITIGPVYLLKYMMILMMILIMI